MSEGTPTPLNFTTLPVGAERRLIALSADASTTVVKAYKPSGSGQGDNPLLNFGQAFFDVTQTGAGAPTFGTDLLNKARNLPTFGGSSEPQAFDTETRSGGYIEAPDPDVFFATMRGKSLQLKEYVSVRLQGRGDDDADALYRFLINPKTVTVDRQTVDVQAQARGGWQLGIWGDDVISISMTGQTAGQYFAAGLSDSQSEYSVSYRNFMALISLFENNGYWFEGEDMGEGALAPDVTRNRIQMHADVILSVGNFTWHGLFQDMTYTEDAQNPYNISFTLSFLAWKERYSKLAPWRNSIRTETYRGHAYEAVQASAAAKQAAKAKEDAERQATSKSLVTGVTPTVDSFDTPRLTLENVGDTLTSQII